MAKSIRYGTAFVELKLDDKVYKQKLSEELTSTEATVKGIETSWRVLGAKSDAVFDAQRRSYENALTLIKNSHNSTAQDIIRAEEAKNAKIKQLNEMQYGHHTTMLDNLKSHYLKVTAAVAVAVAGIATAWSMAKEGADFAEQYGMLDNLTKKYNSTADQIVASMRKASENMIADVDLMSVAVGGLARKLNPQQLIDLADAARILGDAAGKDATTALNELSMALETGKTKALKGYLGTTIDLEAAFGNLYQRLTEAEKAQALYSITMIEARKLQAQMTTAVDDAADKIERIDAQFKNIKTSMAQFFKSAVVGFYDLAKAAIDASSAISAVESGNLAASTIPQPMASPAAATQKGSATKQYEDQIAALKRLLKARQDNEKAGQGAEAMSKRLAVAAEREAKAWHDLADEIQIAQLEASERAGEEEIKFWESLYEEIGYAQLEAAEKAGEAELAFWSDLYDEIFAARYDAAEEEGERELAFWTDLYNEIADRELDAAERAAARRGRLVEEGFSDLAYAMDGISRLYEEGSASAKKWEEASRAMEVAQRAVAVVNAVATIANQGLGDPYTAFARIAAMAAAMGALLATIGESVGGTTASSSASSSSYKSTALGSSEASQSTANAYEILNDTYSMEYEELSKLNDSMKELNKNITGLVTNVVRYGSNTGAWDTWASTDLNQFSSVISDIAESFSIFADKIFAKVDEFLWGSTTTSVNRAGIEAGGATVGGLTSGQGFGVLQAFQELKTETEGGLFGSDSTSYSVSYSKMSDEINRLFTSSFVAMSESAVELAKSFGTDLNTAISHGFNAIIIELQGKTTDEINSAIQEAISAQADTMAETLFGSIIEQYQQIDEGLYETAVRLATDKAIVLESLEMTRQSYSDVISEQIALSESLINFAGDLDTLREAAESFFSNFYSEAEQQAYIETSMTEALANYGKILPKTREEYRALVEEAGLLATEAGQKTYVALLTMSESADAYYSHIEDLAKTSFGMQLEILELEGKTAEATAISRYAELLAMDESLRPMQQRIWALQDEATATQSVSDVTADYMQLLDDLAAKEAARIADLEAAESARNSASNAVNSAIRSRITTVDTENLDSVMSDVLNRAADYWDAMDASLTEVFETEIDALNSSINDMTESTEALVRAKKELLSADEAYIEFTYAQAQKRLQEMLTSAQSGDFSNMSDLYGVLDTLTSTDISKKYGSYTDYKAALYSTAGQIDQLQALVATQSAALSTSVSATESARATLLHPNTRYYTYTDETGQEYGVTQSNPGGKTTSEIKEEIRALREDLRAQASASDGNTLEMKRLLEYIERWEKIGMPETRT